MLSTIKLILTISIMCTLVNVILCARKSLKYKRKKYLRQMLEKEAKERNDTLMLQLLWEQSSKYNKDNVDDKNKYPHSYGDLSAYTLPPHFYDKTNETSEEDSPLGPHESTTELRFTTFLLRNTKRIQTRRIKGNKTTSKYQKRLKSRSSTVIPPEVIEELKRLTTFNLMNLTAGDVDFETAYPLTWRRDRINSKYYTYQSKSWTTTDNTTLVGSQNNITTTISTSSEPDDNNNSNETRYQNIKLSEHLTKRAINNINESIADVLDKLPEINKDTIDLVMESLDNVDKTNKTHYINIKNMIMNKYKTSNNGIYTYFMLDINNNNVNNKMNNSSFTVNKTIKCHDKFLDIIEQIKENSEVEENLLDPIFDNLKAIDKTSKHFDYNITNIVIRTTSNWSKKSISIITICRTIDDNVYENVLGVDKSNANNEQMNQENDKQMEPQTKQKSSKKVKRHNKKDLIEDILRKYYRKKSVQRFGKLLKNDKYYNNIKNIIHIFINAINENYMKKNKESFKHIENNVLREVNNIEKDGAIETNHANRVQDLNNDKVSTNTYVTSNQDKSQEKTMKPIVKRINGDVINEMKEDVTTIQIDIITPKNSITVENTNTVEMKSNQNDNDLYNQQNVADIINNIMKINSKEYLQNKKSNIQSENPNSEDSAENSINDKIIAETLLDNKLKEQIVEINNLINSVNTLNLNKTFKYETIEINENNTLHMILEKLQSIQQFNNLWQFHHNHDDAVFVAQTKNHSKEYQEYKNEVIQENEDPTYNTEVENNGYEEKRAKRSKSAEEYYEQALKKQMDIDEENLKSGKREKLSPSKEKYYYPRAETHDPGDKLWNMVKHSYKYDPIVRKVVDTEYKDGETKYNQNIKNDYPNRSKRDVQNAGSFGFDGSVGRDVKSAEYHYKKIKKTRSEEYEEYQDKEKEKRNILKRMKREDDSIIREDKFYEKRDSQDEYLEREYKKKMRAEFKKRCESESPETTEARTTNWRNHLESKEKPNIEIPLSQMDGIDNPSDFAKRLKRDTNMKSPNLNDNEYDFSESISDENFPPNPRIKRDIKKEKKINKMNVDHSVCNVRVEHEKRSNLLRNALQKHYRVRRKRNVKKNKKSETIKRDDDNGEKTGPIEQENVAKMDDIYDMYHGLKYGITEVFSGEADLSGMYSRYTAASVGPYQKKRYEEFRNYYLNHGTSTFIDPFMKVSFAVCPICGDYYGNREDLNFHQNYVHFNIFSTVVPVTFKPTKTTYNPNHTKQKDMNEIFEAILKDPKLAANQKGWADYIDNNINQDKLEEYKQKLFNTSFTAFQTVPVHYDDDDHPVLKGDALLDKVMHYPSAFDQTANITYSNELSVNKSIPVVNLYQNPEVFMKKLVMHEPLESENFQDNP